MNLTDEWVNHSLSLACEKADFYSGCRKILRNRSLTFGYWDDSLKLADAGYTRSKMTMLTKNYLHIESQSTAIVLWDFRRSQAKYGSVSFTTFNHFVKGGHASVEDAIEARGKRSSVFGPCIQSVVITWLNKATAAVDVFYRTTELFKKFPADLIFIRNVLLAPFDFTGMTYTVSCHFANVTLHPMYAVTIMPLLANPVAELERVRQQDSFFFDWVVKWTSRYIVPEHHRGIAKFSQALRVQKDALERLTPSLLSTLSSYFRENHPGHRNAYIDPDEDEE